MNSLITNLYFQARTILVREEGQDLVEYALVVALIAFGAITGMGALATGLNNAFSQIATYPHDQRFVGQVQAVELSVSWAIALVRQSTWFCGEKF